VIHFNSKLLSAVVLAASVVYGKVGTASPVFSGTLALYNFSNATVSPNNPGLGSAVTGVVSGSTFWNPGDFSVASGLNWSSTVVDGGSNPVVVSSAATSFINTGTFWGTQPTARVKAFMIGANGIANTTSGSAAFAAADWFGFTIAPAVASGTVTLSSLSFDYAYNNASSGQTAFAVYLNGTPIAGGSVTGITRVAQTWATQTLSLTNAPAITSTGTVQIATWGGGGSTTRYTAIDNISLSGAVAVPEPGTLMLAGLGISSLIPFAMRRLRGRKSLAGDDGSSSDESDPGALGHDSAESL